MGKPHSKPRRIVTRLIVFLLLFLTGGAIVNVAVAWGFARRTLPNSGKLARSHSDDPTWYFSRTRGVDVDAILASTFPFADVGWQFIGEELPAWSVVSRRPSSQFNPQHFSEITFWIDAGFGWPFLSMCGRAQLGNDMNTVTELHWAYIVDGQSPIALGGQIIPLQPIWPGFAINSIFYAAILWTAFFVPGVLRRRRRLKRGLCIHCAYDLRGAAADSANCPECGKPMQRR